MRMRYIIVLSIALLLSTPSWGAIAYVTQGNNGFFANGATNITLTGFTGNATVVGVCWDNTAPGTGPVVTDNVGGIYTIRSTVTQGTTSVAVFTSAVNYATQPTQGTVTFGAGSGNAAASFANFSGVLAYGNPVANSGNGTVAGATLPTTLDANNWLVNTICSTGVSTHSTNTGTRRATFGGSPEMTLGTNTVVSAGSLTMNVTISAAQDFAAEAIELRTVAPPCGHCPRDYF